MIHLKLFHFFLLIVIIVILVVRLCFCLKEITQRCIIYSQYEVEWIGIKFIDIWIMCVSCFIIVFSNIDVRFICLFGLSII